MKLKEYAAKLAKLAKKHPNFEVVYSRDDEGNDFRPVHFAPSLGNSENGDFISDDGTEEFKERYEVNAVCIN